MDHVRELQQANTYFERAGMEACNTSGGTLSKYPFALPSQLVQLVAAIQLAPPTLPLIQAATPCFVSVLLHNTRCAAVTWMRDEVLRCLITSPCHVFLTPAATLSSFPLSFHPLTLSLSLFLVLSCLFFYLFFIPRRLLSPNVLIYLSQREHLTLTVFLLTIRLQRLLPKLSLLVFAGQSKDNSVDIYIHI